MRVLVTGASGFVGSAVRRQLNNNNIQVRIMVRKDIQLFENEQSVYVSDVFAINENDWLGYLEDVDAVIHCAWYVKHSDYLNSSENIECLNGSLKLVKAIAQKGSVRFIGIGTCFEYDVTAGILTPDTNEKPDCVYADAKLALKRLATHIIKNSSSSMSWARLFYLYGLGEQPTRLYSSVKHAVSNRQEIALTNGKQIRDFLHVDEAAGQIVDLLHSTAQIEVVNICSGLGQTVHDFVLSIVEPDLHYLLRFNKRSENLLDPPMVVGKHIRRTS